MNKTELEFLKFYMDQSWEEMRHLENLRERVSAIIITLSVAIIGFVIQQKNIIETKPLDWFVVLLGIFGLLMSLKIYQIHQRSQKRLDKWYSYLESNCGENPQILNLKQIADDENIKKFKYISRIPHNYFWGTIFFFVTAAGIYLLSLKTVRELTTKSIVNSTILVIKENKLDTVYQKEDTISEK